MLLLLSGLLLAISLASAEELLPILKVNGQSYTNVTITKVSATDVFFTSSNGMGNAKLKSLDRKLQKHFHYNSAAAKVAERQQAADAAQYHAQVMQNFPQPSPSETNAPANDSGKTIWANSFLNRQGPELFVEKWLTPTPDCRGKFILYDFWATWSPACQAEIPELNGFQKEFSDKLVIIGISDENEDAVRRVADPIIEYAVAIDTQGRTKKAVGISGIPHLMLIDPGGIVRWEGFPFLQGHEFSNKTLADILNQ